MFYTYELQNFDLFSVFIFCRFCSVWFLLSISMREFILQLNIKKTRERVFSLGIKLIVYPFYGHDQHELPSSIKCTNTHEIHSFRFPFSFQKLIDKEISLCTFFDCE